MKYTANDIATILELPQIALSSVVVEQLLTDSRRLVFASQTLFFALPGPRRDGHEFIESLYDQGVRCFVVDKQVDLVKNQNLLYSCYFF